VLLLVACALVLPAAGFALVASREITRAGRAERDTAARHRFLAAFDARGDAPARVPAELLIQTFETIAARAGTAAVELRPGARLGADLGLSAADIEDAALLVTARCEAHLPHGRDLDTLVREARTVEDFVRFLAPFFESAPVPQAA
jgi:hypothetical protein